MVLSDGKNMVNFLKLEKQIYQNYLVALTLKYQNFKVNLKLRNVWMHPKVNTLCEHSYRGSQEINGGLCWWKQGQGMV